MADPSERLGFCALLGFPYGGASRTAEMSARRSFPCGGTSCTAETPARGRFRAAGPLARANRSSRTAELPSLRTFPCGGAFRTAKVSARQSLPHARSFLHSGAPRTPVFSVRRNFPYGVATRTAELPHGGLSRTVEFPAQKWKACAKLEPQKRCVHTRTRLQACVFQAQEIYASTRTSPPAPRAYARGCAKSALVMPRLAQHAEQYAVADANVGLTPRRCSFRPSHAPRTPQRSHEAWRSHLRCSSAEPSSSQHTSGSPRLRIAPAQATRRGGEGARAKSTARSSAMELSAAAHGRKRPPFKRPPRGHAGRSGAASTARAASWVASG